MASILDLLNTTKGEKFISKVSGHTSENKEKVTAAVAIAFPLLLASMMNNLLTEGGPKKLEEALSNEKHNQDFIENDFNPSEITGEGRKILDHILGSNKDAVFSTLGNTIQMDNSSVAKIFQMTAPLLMSILSILKKKENIDASGLNNLFESVMGASSEFDNSLIETFLSKNKDGNIIDEVNGMILGGGNKGKKGGSILGGMTGGK